MKAIVDVDTCTGCGLCASMCPDVFELSGDVAEVKVDEIPEDVIESAEDTADSCPVDAISIEE